MRQTSEKERERIRDNTGERRISECSSSRSLLVIIKTCRRPKTQSLIMEKNHGERVMERRRKRKKKRHEKGQTGNQMTDDSKLFS